MSDLENSIPTLPSEPISPYAYANIQKDLTVARTAYGLLRTELARILQLYPDSNAQHWLDSLCADCGRDGLLNEQGRCGGCQVEANLAS